MVPWRPHRGSPDDVSGGGLRAYIGRRRGADRLRPKNYLRGMGFLDNVKKGLDDAAKGLNKAVSGTNVPSPPPPGAPGANDVDPDFIDGLAPQTWLPMAGTSLDDIVASDEVFFGGGSTEAPTFGEPQVFEIDDAIVARYASTDGSTTIDLASIKESAMIAAGSSDGVCETYGSRLATCGRHDGLGDVSVEGSNGPGHAADRGVCRRSRRPLRPLRRRVDRRRAHARHRAQRLVHGAAAVLRWRRQTGAASDVRERVHQSPNHRPPRTRSSSCSTR